MAKKILHLFTVFKRGNGTYLVGFFLLFFLAIIISLAVRGVRLYQSSHFITNSFTVLITTDEPYIVRLDRSNKTLSILNIKNSQLDAQNIPRAGIAAAIPIQAGIILKNQQGESIDSILSVGTMVRNLIQGNVEMSQMNEFDVLKFIYLAQKVPRENISQKEIDNYIDATGVLGQIQDELYELFRDPTVINERTSIEVVNATQVSGLATSISRMLENGGYNVVAIRSSDLQKSEIQITEPDSVTLLQLQQIFQFPLTTKRGNAVADVRIVVGPDVLHE